MCRFFTVQFHYHYQYSNFTRLTSYQILDGIEDEDECDESGEQFLCESMDEHVMNSYSLNHPITMRIPCNVAHNGTKVKDNNDNEDDSDPDPDPETEGEVIPILKLF